MAAYGVGHLNFMEDIMNKHVCLNILRERLKACAESLGFKKMLHFTMTVTQNILHTW